MKPQDGAAWNLQPDVLEMVNAPASEKSDSFAPVCNHPDYWPGTVMGFDYAGGAKVLPADPQTPSGMPDEAHMNDLRTLDTLKDVNYARRANYGNPFVDGLGLKPLTDGDADYPENYDRSKDQASFSQRKPKRQGGPFGS
jgi:hypothetical protein